MADPFRQDFGASLREARERAGITLRHIAASTKIGVPTLEALERNDLSRLPGGVFTRAFVRAYAREVGLEPEATLNRFLQQFPEVAGDAELRESGTEGLVEPEPRTGGARALRVLAWLLPIAVGVAYFAFLRSGIDLTGVSRTGPVAARPPVPAPPSPQAAPRTALEAAGGSVGDRQPEVEPAAILPAPDAPPEGTAPMEGAQVAAAAVPVPGGGMRVVLATTGPCWLSLDASDGQAIFSGLMQAGERREFDLRGEVVLKAGDAGTLALTINGEAARPLGEAGRVVRVRFSPATFRELLAPR
jgi:cytoskeletal protein RodZ